MNADSTPSSTSSAPNRSVENLNAENRISENPSAEKGSADFLPLHNSAETLGGCCGLTRVHYAVGLLAITTLLSIGAATYFAGKASVVSSTNAPMNALEQAFRASQGTQLEGFQFPKIDASAAASSEKFSMATGTIGESGEGLFVLDHNSGLLQCAVLYPRLAQFLGLFTVNVGDALATGGKGGEYMMVTGTMDFPSSSARPAAPLVVYVLDTSTGNYACYGLPFNRAAVNAGKPQQGMMVLLGTGTANPVADRDSGR